MTLINEKDESINRLVLHSVGTQSADDALVLADCIWMLERTGRPIDATALWAQLAIDFQLVKKSIGSPNVISTRLAYSVSGMMSKCLDPRLIRKVDDSSKAALIELCWRISIAWDQLLAGDVDDIAKDVELEWQARQ
jgi:hypothetical protein